jgi:uncharacterized membrane protein YoaK (UPF0700 family)
MVRSTQTARAAVALTVVAGSVDAVGYLTLSRLFTAHMSGNTIAMAVVLGRADVGTVLERGIPIGVFVLGVAVGTATSELEETRGIQHPYLLLYTLEAVLLLLFWLLGERLAPDGGLAGSDGWPFYVLASLATLPMGVQNATLQRVGGRGVHTTYISGVLTSLARALVHAVSRSGRAGQAGEPLALYGGVWTGYLVGAIAATLIHQRWAYASLLLPLAGLVLVFAMDATHPHELGGSG